MCPSRSLDRTPPPVCEQPRVLIYVLIRAAASGAGVKESSMETACSKHHLTAFVVCGVRRFTELSKNIQHTYHTFSRWHKNSRKSEQQEQHSLSNSLSGRGRWGTRASKNTPFLFCSAHDVVILSALFRCSRSDSTSKH